MLLIVFLVALGQPLIAQAPMTREANESAYCVSQNVFIIPVSSVSIPSTSDLLTSTGLETTKEDIIYYLEANQPELTDLLIKLINCESGFDNRKCGDNGQSCGVLQFKEPTFNNFCQGEWLNPYNQIDCASDMIIMGLGSEHWYNCWRSQSLNDYLKVASIEIN